MHPTMELIEVALPLRRPFRTAAAVVTRRRLILVALSAGGTTGWGEAAPFPATGRDSLARVWEDLNRGEKGGIAGAAVEAARTDLEARLSGTPVWRTLGGTERPLPASEAVGMGDGTELLSAVAAAAAAGIGRVKLKIAPGRDVEPLRLVREAFPELRVGLDANGSYDSVDACPWRSLERLQPAYLEQPFPGPNLAEHASLRQRTTIPICLDESVANGTATVRKALRLEAADLISVKPGRIGIAAALEARSLAVDAGVGLKAGGLLESSVGKAATIAIGTLPGFGEFDLAPAARYFEADVVSDPWQVAAGSITPRLVPGWGITPDVEAIEAVTVRRTGR